MKTKLNRIKKDIDKLATFTSTPNNGVTRSSYTKEDKLAKQYLTKEMKKIGLEVWEDGFSTLFGRREGENPEAPVIMIGSHYDSVLNGGRFDGTAGVVAALETLRVLDENNIKNYYPIEIIAMNAEEGETFGSGTGVSNSRAIAGTLTEEELDTAKNKEGLTKKEALLNYGIIPNLADAKREKGSIKNFIELHIEQGPILDNNNIDIGLVEYLPGIGRYKLKFMGNLDNSSAPMKNRRDPVLGASKFILAVNKIASEIGDGITATIGRIDVSPNIHTFVAKTVEVYVEIRVKKKDALKDINLLNKFREEIKIIEEETGVKTELIEKSRTGYDNPTSPSIMSHNIIKIMKNICSELGYSYETINNGTGHDAMIMTDIAPTNLIYIPSKEGITHHPEEWTDYENIKKGADLMLHLVSEICSI